jgi:sugar phosphate isomerase/epimerase
LKDIDSPDLKMCFDVGHANILGESIPHVIRLIGYDCLKILHCHDNDGKNDLHLPPCEGNIDWRSVTQALHGIGFDGVFNLETEPTKNPDASNARKCEIELAKIAKSVSV